MCELLSCTGAADQRGVVASLSDDEEATRRDGLDRNDFASERLIPKIVNGIKEDVGIRWLMVMSTQAVKIIEGGKLVIPASMRRAMGVAPGDTVVVELLSDRELRVRPLASAVQEAQAIVRKSVQRDRSLADELMRERKQDAARE